MPDIRLATEADAAIIASQRVKMFQDNNLVLVGTWEQLQRECHSIRSCLTGVSKGDNVVFPVASFRLNLLHEEIERQMFAGAKTPGLRLPRRAQLHMRAADVNCQDIQ